MQKLLLDYIYYTKENEDLFEELKKHNTNVYDMLYPVISVLNYFVKNGFNKNDEKDSENIFSFGFEYIHSHIEMLKEILHTVFKNDLHKMIDKDSSLLMILKLDDLLQELAAHDLDYSETEYNELEDLLYASLSEDIDNLDIIYEDKLYNIKPVNFDDVCMETIPDIFVEIAEELGIFLYDEDTEDIIIGEDI